MNITLIPFIFKFVIDSHTSHSTLARITKVYCTAMYILVFCLINRSQVVPLLKNSKIRPSLFLFLSFSRQYYTPSPVTFHARFRPWKMQTPDAHSSSAIAITRYLLSSSRCQRFARYHALCCDVARRNNRQISVVEWKKQWFNGARTRRMVERKRLSRWQLLFRRTSASWNCLVINENFVRKSFSFAPFYVYKIIVQFLAL